MISFDKFIMSEGSPIYLQIILHIKRGIVAGTVIDGDELPSRRVLSALLGVNPNTIQKAYRILEEENLIESHAGAKSYMVLTEDTVKRISEELIREDAENIVSSLKQMGLSKEDAVALIERYWK